MNIWVIGRSYPMKSNKMNGSFELEQAQLLSNSENKISYVAAIFHPFKKVKKWGFCSFKNKDVKSYTWSMPYFFERMYIQIKPLKKYIWDKLLARVEKEQGIPDIIHVHYPAMITIPESILKYQKKGTKIVITEHWSKTLTNSMKDFQREQLIEYVNNADVFICVGQPLKEAVQKITNTNRKIEIIPNVVSHIFKPIEKNVKNYFEFIVVGRLVEGKQVTEIVQAFCEVFKINDMVSLSIIGNGKEEKKIQNIIHRYGMSERVKLWGTLSRKEVAQKVAFADTLICYSKLETFGVPVIEAWACGIPVIASKGLGFLEYWNDELGCLVSANSEQELKEAMIQMVENRENYNAEYISEYVKSYFSEEAVYQKLMSLYTSI